MIRNSDDKTNFPHKLLLTNRQVENLRKASDNYLSTDIKLSKTQLYKTKQSGGFLNFLRPLTKITLTFLKNSTKPLIKNFLIPLGLTTAASVANAGIHKTILWSRTTTLKISNDEMKDTLKIVKSLEDSGLLLGRVNETIKNESK